MGLPGLDREYIMEIPIGDHAATTYLGAGYPHTGELPMGFLWKATGYAIVASTVYPAAGDSYSFALQNAAGNTLATIANATTAIGIAGTTSKTTTITAAYQYIDTNAAASYVKVVNTQSGVGLPMVGLVARVWWQRQRPA